MVSISVGMLYELDLKDEEGLKEACGGTLTRLPSLRASSYPRSTVVRARSICLALAFVGISDSGSRLKLSQSYFWDVEPQGWLLIAVIKGKRGNLALLTRSTTFPLYCVLLLTRATSN